MHSEPDHPSTRWSGRLSDGKTAGSAAVQVMLTSGGLQVETAGAGAPVVWSYAGLGTGTPVSPKAKDVLLTHSDRPGATLFVVDAQFVRAVTAAAPHLTASAFGWRAARPWMALAAVVALIFAAVYVSDLSPARFVAGLMPDETRRTVGKQVLASMTGDRRVCSNAAGLAALDKLVERLAKASRSGKRFQVRVLDWGLINAFAAPGEQIVLTRGIIARASSANEVAGVLAHEMGHGLALHPEASVVRILGMTAALEFLMGGGGGALANIGVLLTQFSYTRSAEREADELGLALLERAQIPAEGLVSFFRRISELEGGGKAKANAAEGKSDGKMVGRRTGAWDLLRTHPASNERAEAAARRPKYPATPALDETEWAALRNICKTS